MNGSVVNECAGGSAPAAVCVTVVESEACHFCADARRVLAELGADYPLIVDAVDVRSETGRLLMARYRATMSPLVLIDGAFFSNGRLPRRKLAEQLTQRYGGPTATGSVRSGGPHG